MTWEPGYREVPATDPPDYQPDEDGDPWGDDYEPSPDRTVSCMIGWHLNCTDHECECECHQDEAEARWESYYHPGEGDRGGPDDQA